MFHTAKNFWATLFFRASAGYSKLLNNKKYTFNTVKISGQLCVSGQALVAQKFWMYNIYSIQWKIPGQLCFSGQAQVTQNNWIIKNLYSVQ